MYAAKARLELLLEIGPAKFWRRMVLHTISQILSAIRRDEILDEEEQCRKMGDFRTLKLLEKEIDNDFSEIVYLELLEIENELY